MKYFLIASKYFKPAMSLIAEVVKAKEDGKLSNDEKSRIMKKFWKMLKIN